MATNVQLNSVNDQGVAETLHPETDAAVVQTIVRNEQMVSAEIKALLIENPNLLTLIKKLGDLALSNGDDIVYQQEINISGNAPVFETMSEIDDSSKSNSKTWSSEKLDGMIPNMIKTNQVVIDDIENGIKYKKPTILNVKETPTLSSVCPITGCNWIVKIYPYVDASDNSVKFTVQEWLGMDSNKVLHRFTRHYNGTAWSDFKAIYI